MHITFSMVLFMDKKKYGNQHSEVEWSFLQKKAVNFTFSFFLQSHSGAFMWKSFHRWCCFESSVWAYCQYLNGLVLLGSFWFSFISHSICLNGLPSNFLRPIWFSPFDFLLWFCIIPFFRLTFKSFEFIRNIFMAYGVLCVQCARYKCANANANVDAHRTLMPFNQATDKHVDGIENKCVRATQYNWDFITLTLICVYFVKFV